MGDHAMTMDFERLVFFGDAVLAIAIPRTSPIFRLRRLIFPYEHGTANG